MADPLDTIARICNEQPHDALTQIADALGYTEQREQERAQREQTLAGLVKRLARRLHPDDPLRVTVTGYLQEQGFFNPLRPAGVAPTVEPSSSAQQALELADVMERDGCCAHRKEAVVLLRTLAHGVKGLDDAKR